MAGGGGVAWGVGVGLLCGKRPGKERDIRPDVGSPSGHGAEVCRTESLSEIADKSCIFLEGGLPPEGFRTAGLRTSPGTNCCRGVLTLGFLSHTTGQLIMQQVNN